MVYFLKCSADEANQEIPLSCTNGCWFSTLNKFMLKAHMLESLNNLHTLFVKWSFFFGGLWAHIAFL